MRASVAPTPTSHRIAVMLDPDRLGFRETATLRGIARYAEPAGWRLVLDPFALQHPPDDWQGVLAHPRRFTGEPIRRSRLPVVLLGWTRKLPGFPSALEGRQEAGRLAARHLVERGYRSFAYLGFTRQTQSAIERRVFAHTLRRLGRRVAAARTFMYYSEARGRMAGITASLSEWLGRLEPPVGIYVARPGFARILAQLALDRGLRIPQDVGIVAADDDPAVCELSPALTSIRFDYAELGYRAAELLGRLLAGEPRPSRATLVEPSLVPRQSTDRQAVADPLVARALAFIDARRTEAIRPADVAAALGVGSRTLQRRLRAAGRDTVQGEILKARVEHAKILLAGANALLPAVARESGFGSLAAMARAFRRHTGQPPSAFRRQE